MSGRNGSDCGIRGIWRIRGAAAIAVVAAVLGLGLVERPSSGFERYRSPDGGGCVACHGDFDGPTSPSGRLFPFDSNHLMHRAGSAMNTECNMCHMDGDERNPYIGMSDGDGFGGGPGPGCLGCHGRDYGGQIGIAGVGLRDHHRNIGVSSCGASSCHRNDPDPLPERVPPPYYGSYDTRAWDACNRAPYFGENFSLEPGNHRGLDNDGDLLYDEDDPDCDEPDCPADLDGSGAVDFADVLALLSAWGDCPGCREDLDANGTVDFADVLIVLSAWGKCA